VRKTILFLFIALPAVIYAQVSINIDGSPPHSSAILELKSSNKGFLPPRMAWPQIQAIQNPTAGLVVFDEGIKSLRMYDGSKWVVIGPKEYDLTDPPGNFSNFTLRSSNPVGANVATIANNKTLYTTFAFSDSLYIGGEIFLTPGPGQNRTLIAIFDSSGNYLFARILPSGANVGSLHTDVNGNLFVTGSFSGTADFDLGPGTQNLTSPSGSSGYFLKYDGNLNFIWAKALSSTTGGVAVHELVADPSGNCYVAGTFSGTLDADPDGGIQNLTSVALNDVFFGMYNSAGSWVWAKSVGGTSQDVGSEIMFFSGTIIVGGHFRGTVDFDPSAGVTNLTATSGGDDAFFARYDGAGAFLWAKRIGGTANETQPKIAAGPGGTFYLGLNLNGTVDIDPDAGIVNLASAGSADFYIAKHTGTGALDPTWYFKVGSVEHQGLNDLKSDNAGNVYAVGTFVASADFDPGAGLMNLNSAGAGDGFLVKYSSSMTFVFAKPFGGTDSDGASFLAVHPTGKLAYVVGSTSSVPWKALNGERFYTTGPVICRYEE
jgi:hypothetical protein